MTLGLITMFPTFGMDVPRRQAKSPTKEMHEANKSITSANAVANEKSHKPYFVLNVIKTIPGYKTLNDNID